MIFAEISIMSDHRRLRKDTIQFLDVKEETSLPVRVLPQRIDVFKLMLGRKAREKELNKELPLMCPFTKNTLEPRCSNSDGCRVNSDPTEWCVVTQIIECYQQAAIPFRNPRKIRVKCQDLYKDYCDIKKQRNYNGDQVVKKREAFIKDRLQALFPAFHDKVEVEIRADKKRTTEKQDEDIAFYLDQMSVRNMALDTRDVNYDKEVRLEADREERKRQREEHMNKRVEVEAKRKRESMMTVNWADVEPDLVVEGNNNNAQSQELKDEDYIPPTNGKEQKTKRPQGQTVFIPPNIMSLIVPETLRLGLTDGQLVGTVAMLLKACDCDLNNFAISHSTARRQREIVNSKVSVDIMLKWVKIVKELGLKIIQVCQEELDRDEENVTKKVKLQAAQVALGNVYYHPDYLTPSNIVMALAGDMMSVEDKTIIARATWEALERAGGRVESFPYKAEFYKKLNICSVWPEEEEKPNLRNFVGHNSLLLFFQLDMADSESLSWLTTEPKEWEKDPSYEIFRKFVKGLDVVNDVAER